MMVVSLSLVWLLLIKYRWSPKLSSWSNNGIELMVWLTSYIVSLPDQNAQPVCSFESKQRRESRYEWKKKNHLRINILIWIDGFTRLYLKRQSLTFDGKVKSWKIGCWVCTIEMAHKLSEDALSLTLLWFLLTQY